MKTYLTFAGALALFVATPQASRADCEPVDLAKLTASDAAGGDAFGCSVSISDDTAVIGARWASHAGGWHAGSAYVFVRSGGVWMQQAKLTASDAADFDEFGRSVSISGNTAVIGAAYDNHAGGADAGSAYVFVRSGEVWTQQAKLTASDATAEDYFGISVSISGDTAVIGAYGDAHAGGYYDAGSAYVFVRSGGVWTQQAKLIASDAAAYDQFGWSVSISGQTAVIGARYDDHAGGTNAGSAYVFVRSGSVWKKQAKLTASDAAAGDEFGIAVSISGDTAVIGAFRDDDAGGYDAGSAYVFARSGGVWTQQAKLTASDAAAYDYFGWSVSISGDAAVIGASLDDHAGGTNAGSAYVFVRSGGVWTEAAKLTASDAAADDSFGFSVSTSSNMAMVGAYYDDHAGGTAAGSAYVFGLTPWDLDGDGDADVDDYWYIHDGLGSCSPQQNYMNHNMADLDGDGCITLVDYQLWLGCYRDFVGNPTAAPPTGGPMGDANGDGHIDGRDVQGFVRAAIEPGGVTPAVRAACDFNGDGAVDAGDVDGFVRVLLGE
jgi:predicted amidohydrolase